MENILTYVRFRKDIPFWREPFNEADAVVFSILSYLDYTGLIEGKELLSSVALKYQKKLEAAGARTEDRTLRLREDVLLEMINARRYQKVRMENYLRDISEEEKKTVYAITFWLSARKAIVAFPGTDNSMLSWKENFTYLYLFPAPGQVQCAAYLEGVLRKRFVKTMVIGHSKGGQLAVYAAMNAPNRLQNKIRQLYLFDAPGFVYDVNQRAEYRNLVGRIKSYVPEDCVIGNLNGMEYGTRTIIHSYDTGFGQHDINNWQITAHGIMRGEAYSDFSIRTSEVFNRLVQDVEEEMRETVVDELFDLLDSNGIREMGDINNMKLGKGIGLLLGYPKLSSHTKTLLKTLLKELRAPKEN